jgi:uncharacterized protein (TIGR00290 family)
LQVYWATDLHREASRVPLPTAYVSWSSGKDSAFALYEAGRLGLARIAGVLTTINEVYDRVAMHGVRSALLDRQTVALGLPCMKVPLPSPCPNDVYETRMAHACAQLKSQGIEQIVFGDLFLADIRAYREEQLAAAGMHAVFPLWQRDTTVLAQTMIASGLVAHIACLDPRRLDRRFAGRRFDDALLHELPEAVDPCGENGEFHTVVTAGPMFSAPIAVAIGETVERDGFVFTDVAPC